MTNEASKIEIAYRKPGEHWKRAVRPEGKPLQRFIAKLYADGAEIMTRSADQNFGLFG